MLTSSLWLSYHEVKVRLTVQWFCLINVLKNVILRIMDQCDTKINLIKYNMGQWLIFSRPVILLHFLNTIWCMNVIIGIMDQFDTKIDLIEHMWVSDLYFMVQWFCLIFMSPNRRGGWTYCFWCRSRRCQHRRWHPHSSLSALYLLNQWVDIDQTGTDSLLGRRKEVITLWWPWSHFQGHTSTLNVKLWPKIACLHPISWTKWWILVKRYVLYNFDSQKIWPYFQGHHTTKTVKLSLVCCLSPEPMYGFQPNLHINTIGTWERSV